MEKHLEQNEIDTLFASARNAAVESSAGAPDPAPKSESYNFSRAGQISNEQMKAIATVNDLFTRNLSHNLGAWLRTQFDMTLVSGEQMTYAEFIERIPSLAYVCSMRLGPMDALGVIQMDLTVVPQIVDLLLGGVGRGGPLREPTDIEDAILLSVMEIVVRELNIAWQSVGLKFSLEKRELEAQVSRMMPMSEKTLCVSFEMRMPNAQGALNLCLPAVVLNTILRQLIEAGDRPRRRSSETRTRLTGLMKEARYGAVLQFPAMRLNTRELVDLAPGMVLRLPLPRHAVAELRVGGLPLFDALPVRSGEHRGAQVQARGLEATESAAAAESRVGGA